MYDIRQFRPTLYILLTLGFTGFALATGSAEVWVLSVGMLMLHGWLIRTKRYRPLPRWMAGFITTVLFLYTLIQLWDEPQSRAVFVLGQFLVFLQLVKLFEVRGNRDYAQLLVLSVLLVVAAAINSASLLFGLVLIAHIFVALYGCLLFHLKLETDQAKALLGVSEDKVPPETLRQDQRYLGRSMRRLTVLVSAASIVMAVLVFLFFPRGSGANILTAMQGRQSQSLTGFSDEVDFQNIARITQNTEPVAYVQLYRNEQPIRGTAPLLFRGRTYNVYSGNSPPGGGPPWQWASEPAPGAPPPLTLTLRADEGRQMVQTDPEQDVWRQHVTLEPNGSKSLFAVKGPAHLRLSRDRTIIYHPHDQTIEMPEPAFSRLVYDVVSTGRLGAVELDPVAEERSRAERSPWGPNRGARRFPRVQRTSAIDPQVEAFARRPEVSGEDEAGPFAERRVAGGLPSELDLEIARSMETYLRTEFEYTLDLTDARRIEDRDPMVAFLYDFKRGHCEYFAGAMTLMLQSLGIEARMVTGFRSDEFNNWGEGYFIVRQSHAHAWVEVLGPDGWETYDPTSSRMADGTLPDPGFWQQVKHAFNYLEYMWADSVVAYDRDSRTSLINTADAAMVNTAGRTTQAVREVRSWLSKAENFYPVSQRVLTGLVMLMVGFSLAAVLWFVFERWRLRQRARRIGLSSLPKADQLRLARQLGFYDQLTQALERRGVSRPLHLTPREFARSIAFLPPASFDAVQRLTDVFYRVRYGQRDLSAAQQRRLLRAVERVNTTLE